MTENLFDYQIQAMHKMKRLNDVLGEKPFRATETLQSFQQSMMQTGMKFLQNMTNNPHHMIEAQQKYLKLLQSPITNNNYERHFKSDLWTFMPYYQWLKETYIKTAQWMIETIEEEALGFDADEKEKLIFLTRQIIEGMNPRNFPHMMELLYFPSTAEKSFREPLVIIPPWINKYYILDLAPENSMIEWLTEKGHNVFCISWANPDETFRDIGFKDYMHDGALKAIEVANDICKTNKANVVGYCIGGTLLAMTQAWLEGKKHKSCIHSATYLTTLLDFEKAGDLRVFIDKGQVQTLNDTLMQNGVMDGKSMSLSFSLIRASDLIWSFVINNYFMGRDPVPFDLLYWISDSTNLPAAMHCDYLQSMYLNNALAKGEYKLDGVTLDLSKIKTPTYYLYTQDDHIAPADACMDSADLLTSTNKTIVIGGSGHIAGVINPPHKNKYHYTISGKKHEGSWWTDWQKWLRTNNKPTIKTKKLIDNQGLESAPGIYVRERI